MGCQSIAGGDRRHEVVQIHDGRYCKLALDRASVREHPSRFRISTARCSRSSTFTLAKACRERPQAFDAFRTIGTKADEDDYAALVTKEMHGGCIPHHVAEQRILQKYGARPDATQICKSESAATDFMATVDAVMLEKGLSRSAAMVEARRRYPGLFDRFQEV